MSRLSRWLLAAAALLLVGSCDGNPFFTEPAGRPAGIEVRYSLSPAAQVLPGGAGGAYDKVDSLEVALFAGEETETPFRRFVVPFSPAQAETRVPIEVQLTESNQEFLVVVVLRAGNRWNFFGEDRVELSRGVTSPVEVELRPLLSGVHVARDVRTIELGDTTFMSVEGLFGTGESLGPVDLATWTAQPAGRVEIGASTGRVVGLQEGVVEIAAAVTADAFVIGEGSGEPVITRDTMFLQIQSIVRSVEVIPVEAGLRPGETLTLTATPRDKRGNALLRTVAWASLDPGVVAVDQEGNVTATGGGQGRVVASVGGVADTAFISVQVGEGRIYGIVRDVESFAPIAGAMVTLVDGSEGAPRTLQTAADGTYDFTGLEAGRYGASVEAVGYTAHSVPELFLQDIPGGDIVRLDFELPGLVVAGELGGIAGRVLDAEGTPVAGATVAISGGAQTNGIFKSTVTAADGTYSLSGIQLLDNNGERVAGFTVIIVADGYGTATIRDIQVSANQTIATIDFALSPGVPAEELFAEGFELGLAEWSASGFWNVTTGTEITNRAFPTYVSLAPDDASQGALPDAPEGVNYAWYGQPTNGNFIGVQVTGDAPLSGGQSTAPNTGTLTSPPFLIPQDVPGATLSFDSWFEIESVDPEADGYDLMSVAVIAGESTTELLVLNPIQPVGGDADQPFTSGGFNRAPLFVPVAVSLDRFRGQMIQLQFTFSTLDTNYNGFRGWIVDDVRVTDEVLVGDPPPPTVNLLPGGRTRAPRPR